MTTPDERKLDSLREQRDATFRDIERSMQRINQPPSGDDRVSDAAVSPWLSDLVEHHFSTNAGELAAAIQRRFEEAKAIERQKAKTEMWESLRAFLAVSDAR
jgi:hypothetical protein